MTTLAHLFNSHNSKPQILGRLLMTKSPKQLATWNSLHSHWFSEVVRHSFHVGTMTRAYYVTWVLSLLCHVSSRWLIQMVLYHMVRNGIQSILFDICASAKYSTRSHYYAMNRFNSFSVFAWLLKLVLEYQANNLPTSPISYQLTEVHHYALYGMQTFYYTLIQS